MKTKVKRFCSHIYHQGYGYYGAFLIFISVGYSALQAALMMVPAFIIFRGLISLIRISLKVTLIFISIRYRRYKAAKGCFNDSHNLIDLSLEDFDGSIIFDGARLNKKTWTYICNNPDGECIHFYYSLNKHQILPFTSIIGAEMYKAMSENKARHEEYLPSIYGSLTLITHHHDIEQEEEEGWDPAIEEFLKNQ